MTFNVCNSQKTENILICSYRAPSDELTGGAARVIAACGPRIWVAPHEANDSESAQKLNLPDVGDVDIVRFPVPGAIKAAHYQDVSNGILWPVLHSSLSKIIKEARHDNNVYEMYKQFINIANDAIGRLCSKAVTKPDLIWVHDYQCVGVRGDIFSLHTPFPSVDQIKSVEINKKPLIECDFFSDFVMAINRYPLVTFQREADLCNFKETLALLSSRTAACESVLYQDAIRLHGSVSQPEKKDEIVDNLKVKPFLYPPSSRVISSPLSAAPAAGRFLQHDVLRPETIKRATVMLSHPIGASPQLTLEEARKGEAELLHSLTSLPSENRQGVLSLYSFLMENEARLCFLSFHRNDYTKRTEVKLRAAHLYFKSRPSEIGSTVFAFFLQPTRGEVPGYRSYEEGILKQAKELRELYGDSIFVEPKGAAHKELMGLLRCPQIAAVLSAAKRDGHDLTLREAVDAVANKTDALTAVIMSDGSGAADVLAEKESSPGAFVLKADVPNEVFEQELAETCGRVADMRRSPEGCAELLKRRKVMNEASRRYTAKSFVDCVLRKRKFGLAR